MPYYSVLQTGAARTCQLVLALVVIGCACEVSEDGHGPRPPVPPVVGVEPRLAARLLEATQVVREQPASAENWGRLAEIYDVNSFEEPALRCYARAEALDPTVWRWAYFSGLLLRSSDPVAALNHFTRAARLEPDYAPLQHHLGFAHYLAENLEQAERHFLHALELEPQCTDAVLGLARVAMARGEPRAALEHLERVSSAAAGEGAVHLHLAQAYRELGRHIEAEREERLTAASPHRALPDGMTPLGDPVREEVKRRECVRAARWLEEARQELLAGRKEQAAANLERALESDPRSVAALVISARLLIEQGQLELAAERLERAVALDAGNADARVELAAVHVLAGRLELAIEYLEQALVIEPELPGGRLKLAGVLLQAGRGERALELLREASRERPDDAEVHEKLALVLVQLDRSDEAAEVTGELAGFQAARGEFPDAARNARSALALVERALRSTAAAADPSRRARLVQLSNELRERAELYRTQAPAHTRGSN